MGQITELLGRLQGGDLSARDALFTLAYDELRKLARYRLKDGGRDAVLDTTALVHEAYLRFVKVGDLQAQDRHAFFAYASQVMRSVVVDSVRERLAERRGGKSAPLTLSTDIVSALPAGDEGVLRVHEALLALEEVDPRLARVVEMRYFGGYDVPEIAATLQLAERTVHRDWEKARMLLVALLTS